MCALAGALLIGHDDAGAGALVRERARPRLRRIDARVVLDVAPEVSCDRGSYRGVLEESQPRPP